LTRKTLEAYAHRRMKVCFTKNLRFFEWSGGVVYGPFEESKVYDVPYDAGKSIINRGFASRELGSVSLEKILQEFSDFPADDFEVQFDRRKVMNHLRTRALNFWSDILGNRICDRCRRGRIIPRLVGDKFVFEFFCPVCNKSYKKNVAGSQFSYWIIASAMNGFFQGKSLVEVRRSLKIESTNQYLHFHDILNCNELNIGHKERIPSKGAIIDILSGYSRRLKAFNSFMMLLMGNLPCKKVLVDDVFLRKSWTRNDLEKWKKTPRRLRRKLKSKRYSYMIVFLNKASNYIIDVYTARNRDLLNFNEAFRETKKIVGNSVNTLIGDKLWPQIQAAKMFFPEYGVTHDFKVRHIKNKDDLTVIERKNRDLRETLPKHRKHSSYSVLRNLVIVAMIGQNYLHPMEILEWKTPAEVTGIPYPFDSNKGENSEMSWNWRLFLVWIDWVINNAAEILTAGRK
jgi:hypothetical protein